MVTCHYNSSLTVHPDTSNNYAVKIAKYFAEGKCKFGLRCMSCQWFLKVEQMKNRERGNEFAEITANRCTIWHDKTLKSGCPGINKQRDCGKKEKSFGIDYQTYNAIADRCAWMYQNKTYKLLFVVLTFPNFKRDVTEIELNQSFSKFIENMRAHYHLRHYLAIREGDGINTRFHYHVIFDMPFMSFTRINAAWNSAISDFCDYSKNAFRTKRKSYFIRDISGAVRYLCKYISKSIGQRSLTRIFFCDRETANAFVKIRFDNEIRDLQTEFKSMTRTILNDYVCRITFKSKRDQNVFFNTVVKTLFGVNWNATGMYIFPEKPPD